MQDTTSLLQQLTAIHAVSGYEDDMVRFLYQYMASLADEVEIDPLGNVIAIKKGSREGSLLSKGGFRLALFAHIDEVGFMVKKCDPEGSLRLLDMGGNSRALPGQEVQIRTFDGRLARGLVGIKSAHLTSEAEQEQAIPIQQLRVYPIDDGQDIPIEVGNTVSFRPGFHRLGKDLVSSKALDNRAGCFVLLEVLRRLQGKQVPADLAFLGTVQEEISCEGSLAPIQRFGAQVAITVDGTVAYDTPDLSPDGEVRCGAGPVILRYLRTRGLNGWTPNPKLALYLEKIAGAAGIAVQRDGCHGLMSDAKPLRLAGIPSAVIGIPIRGMHSPAEIVSLADLEQTIRLLVTLLQQFDGTLDLSRG